MTATGPLIAPTHQGRSRLILATAIWGACFSLSGCVTRYARIIALSSPALANVKVANPASREGPTPAYIDEKTRFLLLAPQRRSYELIFDHDNCATAVTTVPVTKWGKTAKDGPTHVTSVKTTLKCGQP
jgi:hypothetical protein